MKLIIVLFSLLIFSGCQTAPTGISLVYRKFEPTKGGRILITSAPQSQEDVKRYRKREREIMANVCAPEGFKLIDEGLESTPGSITSYELPYGQRESVVGYSTSEFKNFQCTGKPMESEQLDKL